MSFSFLQLHSPSCPSFLPFFPARVAAANSLLATFAAAFNAALLWVSSGAIVAAGGTAPLRSSVAASMYLT